MYFIALTGGPCAGKDSLIAKIFKELPEKGFNVFAISEAASTLIMGGIHPGNNINMNRFQEFVLDYQLFQEEQYRKLSNFYDSDKTVVIVNRGICDQIAYCGKDVLENMLKERGLTLTEARDRYDSVIFLQSAANGAEEFYSLENVINGEKIQIRTETVEQARELNNKTLEAWIGSPHLKVIGNEGNFEDKLNRAMQEIYNVLDIPAHTEIERKFLIHKPSDDVLNSIELCSKTEIIQTYLKETKPGTERRVRQRGINGEYSFYYTEKTCINGSQVVRAEVEKKISQKEYINYLSEVDYNLHQIHKTRYCFVYKNQYFELDIYNFSNNLAVIELELELESQNIEIPDFIDVIREVTEEKEYKNYQLARCLKFVDESSTLPPLSFKKQNN